MIKQLIILATVLAVLDAQCGNGCLRCQPKINRCLFCDVNSGYVLAFGRCQLEPQFNCAQATNDGDCLVCKTGFYIDSNTNSCVEVPKEVSALNCQIYSDQDSCILCNQGYYLKNGGCVKPDTPIQNCEVQINDTLCHSCVNGYIPSLDHKSCVSVNGNNCLSYSFLECKSCVDGYIKNTNNYIYTILGFHNTLDREHLSNFMVTEAGNKPVLSSLGVCQPYAIINCSIYSTFNTCEVCNSGFLLQSDGTCLAYAKERINYCEKYTSLTNCIRCIAGKFLKNANTCADNVPISSCMTYSATASVTTCVACESNYYLLQNKCNLRTSESNISNCLTLSVSSETCNACNNGFVLTGDKKKCLANIANCLTYKITTVSSTENECITCVDGFYIDNNSKTCVQGGIENCLTYQTNANICAVCKNRYLLTGTVCKPHDFLGYCVKYSASNLNTCTLCDDNSYLFSFQNTCAGVNKIDNCQTYSAIDTCSECALSYYIDGGVCKKIPVQERCLRKNGVNCIKCDDNYVLENGACKLPLDIVLRNCDSHNIDGLKNYSQITCNYCKENSLPINYVDNYLCYENDYIDLKLGFVPDVNCLQYMNVSGTYKCKKCIKEKYLQNGACVDACSGATSTIHSHALKQHDSDGDGVFDSFSIDSVATCNTTLANCKVATPDLYQPDPSTLNYSCIQCNDSFVPVVSLNNEKTLLRAPIFDGDIFRLSPVSYLSPINCADPAVDVTVIGNLNSTNLVDNCDSYYNVIGLISGCLKCKHSFTGIVVDTIFNCKTYTDINRCSECKDGYYLATSEICKPVLTPVANCKKHSTTASTIQCVECIPEFYLSNATTCTVRASAVTNCATNTINTDTCATCNTNFWLTANTCKPMIPNCTTHAMSGADVECNVCSDNYFVHETKCNLGTITNCETYNQSSFNICTICNNNFYLKDNTCSSQSTVTQCKTFGQTKGQCLECNAGYFLMSAINNCAAVTPITNCTEYSSLTTCKKCSAGNYVANDAQRCLVIPASWNCAEYGDYTSDATNGCVKCNADYLLKDGYCEDWYNLIKTNCDNSTGFTNGETASIRACTYCSSTYEAIDFADDYICLEQDLIDSWVADVANTLVMANCVRYQYLATPAMKCIECASGYVIDSTTNGCIKIASCPVNSEIFTMGMTISSSAASKNLFTTSSGPYCKNDNTLASPANLSCYYAPQINPTVGSDITYYCSKCFSDFLQVVDLGSNNMVVTQGIDDITSPIQSFIAISDCMNPATTINTILGIQTLKKLIKNCDYYYVVSGTNYGCLACKKGYTGVVKAYDLGVPGTSIGFIEKCDTGVTNCTNAFSYSGIVPSNTIVGNTAFPVSVLFNSCHKCSSGIPFAMVNGNTVAGYDEILGLWEYTTADVTTVPTIGEGTGLALECINPTGPIKGVTITNFPSNCALGILNATSTATTSASLDTTATPALALANFSAFCAACKPGYSASRMSAFKEVIADCKVITNCTAVATWTWLNVCEQCDTSFSYMYNKVTGLVQYDVCSPNSFDANCLVISDSNQCVFCKKGYYLNTTKMPNICEILTPPLCTNYYNNGAINYQYNQLGYYLAPKPDSCASCANGYVLAKNFHNNAATEVSDNIPTSKKYCGLRDPAATIVEANIANCKVTALPNYFWNYNIQIGSNFCTTCDTNYIGTRDGRCVISTNYPNCTTALDTTSNLCSTCNANYASVAGVCKSILVGGGVIAHCVTYEDTTLMTGAKCTQCANGYYVSNQGTGIDLVSTCVLYSGNITNCDQFDSSSLAHIYCTKCSTNYALLVLKNDNNGTDDGFSRKCVSIAGKSDANCSTWDVDSQKTGELECTSCNAITLLVESANADDDIKNYCVAIPTTTNCAEYDVDTTLANGSYNPTLSTLMCNKCDAAFYLNNETGLCVTRTNNAIANCSVYEIAEDACKTCAINYLLEQTKLTCKPLPAANTSPAVSIGYILSCREMQNCTQIYYEGLHPHINAMASCHKCISSTQIPFLAVRGGRPYDKITGLNEYSLTVANNLTDGYDLTHNGSSVFCTQPTAANLSIPVGSFTFPTNCGFGIANTNAIPNSADATKTTAVDRTKISAFCGACAPGYKATYSTDNTGGAASVSFMIGACAKIDNCESSSWFNNCTQCSPGYSYVYTDANGVQYDRCVAYSNNKDCHLVDITDVNNYKCKYCNKGSYLNSDGYCERIKPPRCSFAEFNFRLVYDIDDLSTGLFMNQSGTGCQKCENGFTGIYQDNANYICTHSEYHDAKKLTNTTKYLLNCKKYYISNGLLKCQECYDAFIPIDQTRNCTSNASLANCLIASNSDFCKECKKDYVLVNRKCEKQNINNCVAYSNNESSTIQNCSVCAEGYYLMANVCIAGDVANCLIYETRQVCQECNNGYTLAKQKNGVSYCYPIDPSTNCKQFDEISIQSGILKCSTCISNEYVISTDTTLYNPSLCMRYTEIANCLKYDIQTQIGNSTFSCVNCVDNFFVNAGNCRYRNNRPSLCVSYTPNADTCAQCADRYFVEVDGKSCVPYPIGVRGCRIYSDLSTCTSCDADKYLSNNQCIDLVAEQKIANCLYYLSATSCRECKTGNLLTDGVCKVVVALNCATYTNINTCATCAAGYGFQTVDGVKQCVLKNIQFCLKSTDEFPFSCTVCSNGYYHLAGVCTQVPAVIPYCLEYSADASCNRCDRGMALDTDFKSCVSTEFVFDLVDYMCYDTLVSAKPKCSSCQFGFYFKSGECIACATSDNCRGCDPVNPSVCLMCSTGYYQNEDGKCQINATDKPGVEPPTPESSSRLVALMSSLFIIMALLH